MSAKKLKSDLKQLKITKSKNHRKIPKCSKSEKHSKTHQKRIKNASKPTKKPSETQLRSVIECVT